MRDKNVGKYLTECGYTVKALESGALFVLGNLRITERRRLKETLRRTVGQFSMVRDRDREGETVGYTIHFVETS